MSSDSHAALATWAADCAGRVLDHFQLHSEDEAPEVAIKIARQWSRGDVKTGVAQKASVAAHASARRVTDPRAIAAARAAGHAVATAHFADHCVAAAIYSLKAVAAAGQDMGQELAWQADQLPSELRMFIVDELMRKLTQLGIEIVFKKSV